MDRAANDHQYLSGLPSPFPSTNGDSRSEASPTNQSSLHFTQLDNRPNSDYGSVPTSSKSASFVAAELQLQNHRAALQRDLHPAGSMASNSSSLNLQDGAEVAHPEPQEDAQQLKSDPDVPIDPNMSASPQYASYGQAGMYGHPGEHAQHYPTHQQVHYHQQQPRPDWAGYNGSTPITPNSHSHIGFHPQTTPTGQRPGNQVFSFVPIPGSQQHKRPRRRYEEIERMYKCGWNGCEKAYGTLNHLNAHVTMQSHGQKRVPEEFKEIRKEWKARKKEADAARKAQQDEQSRAEAAGSVDSQSGHDAPAQYNGAQSRLPPLSYNPASYPSAPQYSTSASEYAGNYITAPGYGSSSPYAQSHQQVYGQSNGGPTH